MAFVKFSAPVEAIRGSVGDVTYKRHGDGTLMTKKPGKRKKDPTVDQLANQNVFTEATRFGKRVLADPELGPLYLATASKRGTAIYALFVEDYRRPPRIESIDVSAYDGALGSTIAVGASDVVMVTGVTVAIVDEDGREIECGEAEMTRSKTSRKGTKTSSDWRYGATATVPAGTTVRIVVTARDVPGHTSSAEMPVSLGAGEPGAVGEGVKLQTIDDIVVVGRPGRCMPAADEPAAPKTEHTRTEPAWPSLEDVVLASHVDGLIILPEIDDADVRPQAEASSAAPKLADETVQTSLTKENVESSLAEPAPYPTLAELALRRSIDRSPRRPGREEADESKCLSNAPAIVLDLADTNAAWKVAPHDTVRAHPHIAPHGTASRRIADRPRTGSVRRPPRARMHASTPKRSRPATGRLLPAAARLLEQRAANVPPRSPPRDRARTGSRRPASARGCGPRPRTPAGRARRHPSAPDTC